MLSSSWDRERAFLQRMKPFRPTPLIKLLCPQNEHVRKLDTCTDELSKTKRGCLPNDQALPSAVSNREGLYELRRLIAGGGCIQFAVVLQTLEMKYYNEVRNRGTNRAFVWPEARSQKPEARSQKPEARSQKPEARSQKPEARSQKQQQAGRACRETTTNRRLPGPTKKGLQRGAYSM